jgi:hypothetical protein
MTDQSTTDDQIRRELMTRLTVPLAVAGRALGLGRQAGYAAVRRGDIPAFKVGKRFIVPTPPLRRMLGLDTDPAA